MNPEDIKKIREDFEYNKLDSVALLEPICEALLDEVEKLSAKLKVAEDALEQYAGFSPSLSIEGKTLELDCSFIAKDALKKIREV